MSYRGRSKGNYGSRRRPNRLIRSFKPKGSSSLDFSPLAQDENWWYYKQDMANNDVVLTEDNGKVVGMAAYHFDSKGSDKELVIDKIITAPNLRGSGIGKNLLADIETRARKSKANKVIAFPLNDSAKAFFRRNGYSGDVAVAKRV